MGQNFTQADLNSAIEFLEECRAMATLLRQTQFWADLFSWAHVITTAFISELMHQCQEN